MKNKEKGDARRKKKKIELVGGDCLVYLLVLIRIGGAKFHGRSCFKEDSPVKLLSRSSTYGMEVTLSD